MYPGHPYMRTSLNNTHLKIISALVLLSCFLMQAGAQEKDNGFSNGISLTAGLYAPLTSYSGSDLVLNLSYGRHFRNGLGYIAGIQYIPSIFRVNDVMGVPLAVAFSGSHRSFSERIEDAAQNAARSAWTTGGDSDAIWHNALMALFNQMQFYAGITPGFIFGSTTPRGWSRTGSLSREEFWTEKASPLYLSLDAGINLNCSIWRFDLTVRPAIHYWVTRSLIRHTSIVDEISGPLTENAHPARWFFSLSGGLSFRF